MRFNLNKTQDTMYYIYNHEKYNDIHVRKNQLNQTVKNYKEIVQQKKKHQQNNFNLMNYLQEQKKIALRQVNNNIAEINLNNLYYNEFQNVMSIKSLIQLVLAMNEIKQKHTEIVIKKGLYVYLYIIKKYCNKTLCMNYKTWCLEIVHIWEKQLEFYLQNNNCTILDSILNHLILILIDNDSIFNSISMLNFNEILDEKNANSFNFIKTIATNFCCVATNVLAPILKKYIICVNNEYMYFDKIWHTIGNISINNVTQKNKLNAFVKNILTLVISHVRNWLETNNLATDLSAIELAKLMTIDDNKMMFQEFAIYLINNIENKPNIYYKNLIDVGLTADSLNSHTNLVFSNLLILPHTKNITINEIKWRQYIYIPVGSTVNKTAHVQFNYTMKYHLDLSNIVLRNIFILANGKFKQMMYICSLLSLCLDTSTEKSILEFCDLMKNGDNGKSKLMQWMFNVLSEYIAIGNIDDFLSKSKKEFDFGSLLQKTMIIFQDTCENHYATFNNKLKAYISEEQTSIKIKHKENVLINVNASIVWLHNGLFQIYLSKNTDNTLLQRFEVLWTEYYLGKDKNKFCLPKDNNVDYHFATDMKHYNSIQLYLMYGKTLRLYAQNNTSNLQTQWQKTVNKNIKFKYTRKDFAIGLTDKEITKQFYNIQHFFLKQISENIDIVQNFDCILAIKTNLEEICITMKSVKKQNNFLKIPCQTIFQEIKNKNGLNFYKLTRQQQKFVLTNVLKDKTGTYFFKKI